MSQPRRQDGTQNLCPRCNGRPQGESARECPWCDAVLNGSAAPNRGLKRAAIVCVVVVLLGIWALIVPADDWNATNATLFGVVGVFMLSMAWVLSGSLIDP